MPPYSPLNPQPMQKRSKEKIEKILETTYEMLLELPLEDINTNLIAKRAGIQIGSLYHFFPDKYAIFNTLIYRALNKIDETLMLILSEISITDKFEKVIEAIISQLSLFSADSHLIMNLWFSMQKHADTEEVVNHFESIWIPKLAERLMLEVRELEAARTERIVFVILQSIYTALEQSASMEEPEAKLFIEEVIFSLKSYINALHSS